MSENVVVPIRQPEELATAKDLVRRKLDWLEQVAADQRLPPAAPRIAIILATKYINGKSADAWPAISTLSDQIGASENTVRSALRALGKRQHISVVFTSGGKGQTNHYTPMIGGKPFKMLKGSESRNPSNLDRETLQNRDSKPSKILEGNPFERNPLKEPIEGGLQPPLPQCPSSESEDKGSTLRRGDKPAPRVSYQTGEAIKVEGEFCEITEVKADMLSIIFNEGGAVGEVPRDPATGRAMADRVCWLGRDYADDLDDDIPY